MMKPWKRKEGSLPVVDDTELLDVQEQEKMVQSLEASQSRQSLAWRVVFATLAFTFSGFFLISAFWQAISPWELKFHAYFMEDMSSVSVVAADIAEAVVFASIAWGVLSSNLIHINAIWISLGAGFGLAIFWFYQMQSLSRMHWDLLWLPLGPCRIDQNWHQKTQLKQQASSAADSNANKRSKENSSRQGSSSTPVGFSHSPTGSRCNWTGSSCAALCLYVNNLLVETEREVGKLRAAMYHFKRT